MEPHYHGRSWKSLLNYSKNNDSFLSFSLTLIVRGDDLDSNWLTSYLGITPTQTYKYNGSVNEERLNAWYFKLKANDIYQLNSVSNEFFQIIKDVGVKLVDKNTITAEIVLHIHAELAQVYFDFPQNMISDLAQSRIPFGISILDWGEVKK
ncbi:MAG: hypothetical protein ACYCYM_13965 [Saccharofermentanales bacterium]